MNWLPWVLLPGVGAMIGYATNWLAIKMLFHPRQPRFGMHGLLPRRHQELARSVGEVVGKDVVQIDDLLEPLQKVDFRPHFAKMLDNVIEKKLSDFKKIPLIGSMLTPETFNGLREAALDELEKNQPQMIDHLQKIAAEHIDIAQIAQERIAAFELETLEAVVHRVAKTEFRAIELWGAGLGLVIGLVQALIISLLPAS